MIGILERSNQNDDESKCTYALVVYDISVIFYVINWFTVLRLDWEKFWSSILRKSVHFLLLVFYLSGWI